jgi:hypothetical protein
MRFNITLLAILVVFSAKAQVSGGGFPPSFDPAYQALFSNQSTPIVSLASVDRVALMAEDAHSPLQTRFAAPVSADISMQNAGKWTTLPDGSKLWQCALRSPGGLGLTLLFDQFLLPDNVKFYAYAADHQRVLGCYTSESCLPSGKFLIGIVPGETVYMECVMPADVVGATLVHLYRADVAYDSHAMNGADFDFGGSSPCNVNVNCPTGNNWQAEKKGIARILMVFQGGEAWCSGTLIANTAGTFDPYLLTAQHCQLLLPNPEFDLWRFDFNYETPGCTNPATEPAPKSVLGCTRISYRAETDFMLLKTNPIPVNYDVYFNGWDRDNTTTTLSPNTVMIHHPFGDIKKITVDTQSAIIHPNQLNWGGVYGISPTNTHWKTVPDIGIQQPGSSGSPLFDASKRIRGQLHGGSVSPSNPCIMTGVYYGRFNQSWDQAGTNSTNRLREWLDPAGTNVVTQNGYVRPLPVGFKVSGTVTTHWGIPMPNTTVRLTESSGTSVVVVTDTLGRFVFENVAGGGSYSVLPERDINDLNGITTLDMVLISKHILGIQSLNSPWKMIAADVNNSKSITTFDIVEARKVLLGIYPAIPATSSWRFLPAATVFSDPNNPFNGTPAPETITITNLQADYLQANFKGIKIADVNNSADPGQ